MTQCVAVLGTGSIGQRHADVLRGIGARVVLVPARPQRTAVLRKSGWEVAGSLEEARARGASAAVIATETGRHPRDTVEALSLGMNVMCEKPLAIDANSAREIGKVVSSSGCFVFVGCCLRFEPGLVEIRGRLAEVGELHSLRIECRSYLPDWRPTRPYLESYSARASEGGVLRDLIHEIDYAIWLTGTPKQVFGVVGNTGRIAIESEEMAHALWASPDGTEVSIELDYLSRFPVRSVRAAGSQGEIRYDFLDRRLELLVAGRERVVVQHPGDFGDVYVKQAEAFLKAAITGRCDGYLATFDESVFALAVCDAWRASAASGKIQEVMP